MDWAEIGTQVIVGIVGVLITGLGTLITILINKFVKDSKLKNLLLSLNEVVKNAVLEVQQTYVDNLKKNGTFDLEAQKEALAQALNLIKQNLSSDTLKWLQDNYTDIDSYLKGLIEATIGSIKIGNK